MSLNISASAHALVGAYPVGHSGDVDQRGEMEILPRELDAHNAAMIAIERVGKRGRAGHPEGVGGVFKPPAVQGSESGCAEALRGPPVALVSRPSARFGEAESAAIWTRWPARVKYFCRRPSSIALLVALGPPV